MTEKIFHFVRHHEVTAYERIGWVRHASLDDTHHGAWSSLMEWKGQGEPVKPFRISHETDHAEQLARDVVGEMERCE